MMSMRDRIRAFFNPDSASAAGGKSREPSFFNLGVLLTWMGGFLLVAWIAVLVLAGSDLNQSAAMTVWVFGICAAGASVGFLFGVPRVLVAETNNPTASNKPDQIAMVASLEHEVRRSRLAANTNLEQVSDWLTKVLVGVGLVQLRELPDAVNRLAVTMAPSFGAEPLRVSVATGVIVVFSVGGFLVGYITTRAFVPKLLQDAEDMAVDVLRKRADAVQAMTQQDSPR